MSKTTVVERAYLTIEVDKPWGNRSWAQAALASIEEVRTLLDAARLGGLGEVDYRIERRTICDLCKREWEVDPNDGAPLCCDAAVLEWEVLRAPAQPPRDGEGFNGS